MKQSGLIVVDSHVALSQRSTAISPLETQANLSTERPMCENWEFQKEEFLEYVWKFGF